MTDDREIGGLRRDSHRRWRSDNINRQLMHVLGVFEERMLAHVHATGLRDVRMAHLKVMRHVDFAGTRMAVLAERAGITKGAMSQAVAICVRDGLLEVGVDPADSRARRVQFTDAGARVLAAAQEALDRVERDARGLVGDADYDRLQEVLARLSARLAEEDGTDA